MKRVLFIFLIAVAMTACEQIKGYVESITNAENIAGLKEALTVGIKKASGELGQTDGYLNDPLVKILLPEEAQTTFNAIQTISNNKILSAAFQALGGIDMSVDFKDVLVTAINRSAEDAAPQAVDIFANAITSMTISDATSLLFTGNNTAATEYLHEKTYGSLQSVFGGVIDTSLSKVEVGEYTALEAWTFFAEQNNKLAGWINNSSIQTALNVVELAGIDVSPVSSIKEVSTSLGEYTTGKALDGLFLKVGNEETSIRTDVNARTSELLKKVFGQLD